MITNINYTENKVIEAKYQQLERLGADLGVPVPRTLLQLEAFDGNGNLIHAHRQRSHSWNRNFYNWMMSQMATLNLDSGTFGPSNLNLKDTAGTTQTTTMAFVINCNVSDATRGLRGESGDDNHGIIVGSGTLAENFEHYSLQSKITNGTGPGQLSYIEQEPYARSYDPVSKTYSSAMARFFNNNSGASVSINETGLVVRDIKVQTASLRVMVCRDVLVSTITLPDTGQLKVTYTIELVYPD